MKDNIIFINYTGKSGIGTADYEMTKSMVDNGLRIIAVVSKDLIHLEQWETLDLVKLIKIKTYSSRISFIINSIIFFLFGRFALKKELKDFNIRYVYLPMICLWSDMINSCVPNAKIITVIHDPTPHSGEDLISKFMPKKCIYNAHKIIVHSKKFIPYVENTYRKKGYVYYLPLGRHQLYSDLSNSSTKKVVDYQSNKINFLFFGRISKYKGLHVLADAYRIVCTDMHDITLTIVGNGSFSEFETSFDSLPNITLINRWIHDEEVSSIFTGENVICVLPYIDATQSGVVLVSMENDVPIIATNTGGLSEQISDGITGILVPPSNAEALAEAMLNLASDSKKRDTLTINAKEYLKTIDWDSIVKSFIQLLNE